MATIKCPQCGKDVPSYETVCPACGTDMNAASIKSFQQARKSAGNDAGAAVKALLVICVLVVAWVLFKGGTSTESYSTGGSPKSGYTASAPKGSGSATASSKKYTDEELKTVLYIMSTDTIKKYLKSPSSAKFSEMYDCGFSRAGSNSLFMKGWVDAQNSYGAVLRQDWSVAATYDNSTDKMDIALVTIGDDSFFP